MSFMLNLYISLYKKHFNCREFIVYCIDSKFDWDAEKDGKEPSYDTFIEFLSDIVFEIGLKYYIFAFHISKKRIKTKDQLINYLKKYKSSCQWLFIIVDKKRKPKIRDFTPYYLDLSNSYKYDPHTIEKLEVLFYLEVGIKYLEIQSFKLKEEKLTSIIMKYAQKYNYNIIFEKQY